MGIEIADRYYGKDDLEIIRTELPDLEENEDYWWNRGKCAYGGCDKSALSFSKACWEHMSEGERKKLRKQLQCNCASGKDLRGINLQGVRLDKVVLAGGRLDWANFSGADLNWVNLSGAHVLRANFEGAELRKANLSGAIPFDANLSGAYLFDANLSGAYLRTANLSGADLILANLEGTDLRHAYLFGAYLREANLSGADMAYADLRGADLSYARVGKYVVYNSIDNEAHINSIAGRESEDIKKFLAKLERVEEVICKPSDNIKITNFKGVKYNPHTRLYFHLYACLKWLLYYIKCKKKREQVDKKKFIGPYRQTRLIGIDTTDLDWSKHPQLVRDIHYQQFLDAFKNRSWFHKYIMYPLWGITSYFGEMLSLWLFWAGVIISTFACSFYYGCSSSSFLPYAKFIDGKEITRLIDAIYLSGVIFTSLGLGNFEPVNDAAKWWILAEVMLGFIMLGSLVSFFANKFVRRD